MVTEKDLLGIPATGPVFITESPISMHATPGTIVNTVSINLQF